MKRLLVIVLLLLGPRLEAQVSTDFLNVNALMAQVVEKALENDELKQKHFRFTKTEITKNLSKNSKEKIGKPKWQGAGLKNEPMCLDPNDLLGVLLSSYDFVFDGVDTENGKTYYKVNFSPRAGIPDEGSACKKAALRLTGTLWVDTEHLYAAKLMAQMPDDFSKEFNTVGGFGKVKWVNVDLRQSRKDHGIVAIDSLTVQVKYRVWFLMAFHYFEQYKYVYSNYTYIP